MLHRWLNEPGVVRWWEGDDVSYPAVVHDYGSANPWPAEHWIMQLDGRDVGWIQCYLASDDPEETAEWSGLGVSANAAGIDYLIGEPVDRGGGLGSTLIEAFVDQIVFGQHPGWDQAAAAPYEANTASWRALQRAGFRHLGTVQNEGDADGPGRLMVKDRQRDGAQ